MIIVITCLEKDKYGNWVRLISRGVDDETGKIIPMPCDDVRDVNYLRFDKEINEYVLKEN